MNVRGVQGLLNLRSDEFVRALLSTTVCTLTSLLSQITVVMCYKNHSLFLTFQILSFTFQFLKNSEEVQFLNNSMEDVNDQQVVECEIVPRYNVFPADCIDHSTYVRFMAV